MDPTAWNRTAWTIGLILFFAALYVAGYAANLEPGVHYCMRPGEDERIKLPHYRAGGKSAELFFWPVFQADVHLRPQRWPEASPEMCMSPECR